MSIIRDLRRSYFSFRENAGGVVLPGLRLTGQKGQLLGYVEQISYTPNSVVVEGWADAEYVFLSTQNVKLAGTLPCIHRQDVQTALSSAKAAYGFSIKIPAQPSSIQLTVTRGDVQAVVKLPHVCLLKRAQFELALSWRYIRLMCSALPDIINWVRHRDPISRRRVGAMFRSSGAAALSLDMSALQGARWAMPQDTSITIVMPVYDGLHLLDQAIGRVRDHTDIPWHLIVIDDASPNPAVLHCLNRWQKLLTEDQMTLIANPVNVGFVGAANMGIGIALKRGFHTVLLNSDALVPAGWASRLLAPLLNGRKIASVTPFSNDAEISNVPIPGRPIALLPGEGDALDHCANNHSHTGSIAEAPTGVGFCMALNIEALRQIPAFDAIFGRGYGEEVDWCQKAAALGWRNIITAGLFVEHQGGQSFGLDAKQALIRKNGLIISRRYPNFDEEVQTFLAKDPLRSHRMMLGINMAARRAAFKGQRLSVFLGHGMGGGAETYLRQRVQQEISSIGYAVVIRTMPDTTWHVELHTERGKLLGKVDRISATTPFFTSLTGLHIVYSCGVGTAHPRDIPFTLKFLASLPNSTLEVAFNDFFPISPSYTLLDSRDAFHGLPLDSKDPAHQFIEPSGSVIELAEWTNIWGEMIKNANYLTTFSPSSAAIVSEAWPEQYDRVHLEPHRLPTAIPTVRIGRDDPVIGVLGNISRAKGADALVRLSKIMAFHRVGRVVLVGNIEPGYVLSKPSQVLGSYHLEDLETIVDRYGINRWFFPSIWPETFSYAVHEMIATGLPVWSFDLGGQADAVKAALVRGQGGGLVPLHDGKFDVDNLYKLLVDCNYVKVRESSYAD